MPVKITTEVKGMKEVLANMRVADHKFADALGAAIYERAQLIMTDAKLRCPVDTGALRASGYVTMPEYHGRRVEVELGFGGAAKSYALAVHERTEVPHPVGEPKFLEHAADAAAPRLGQDIITRAAQLLDRPGITPSGQHPVEPEAGAKPRRNRAPKRKTVGSRIRSFFSRRRK